MSAESWKLENDLCRCCHSEGSHKNLTEPCLEGEEEVYSAMLQETLDINIVPVSGPLGSVTYTICEVCIMRLQDAWSFKQQVLQCENRFHDLYTRNVIKMEPDSVIINVKEEAADSENEGFKEGRLADDSDEDFSMPYEDGTQKSDESEIEIKQETKKAKPKPKAKPKAKAPAKAAGKKKPVARSVPAADAASSEAQSEEKEKKDESVSLEGQPHYSKEKGKYRCNLCDLIRNRVWDIKKHITVEHLSENGIPCPLCEIKFKKKSQKNRHLAKVHSMVEKMVRGCPVLRELKAKACGTCKMEFKTFSELTKHEIACGNSKPDRNPKPKLINNKISVCPQCSREVHPTQIRRHLSEEHGLDVPTCGICGHTSHNNAHVMTHQRRVHFKDKNFTCSHCDMKFYSNSQLKMHIVRHDPVKKFECKFCKKRFPRNGTLRTHEKIHTGDKKIVCYVCGDRFVQKASLNYHMSKRHPDKAPHKSSYQGSELSQAQETDRVKQFVASKATAKEANDAAAASE